MTILDAAYWATCLVLVTSGATKLTGPDGFAAFIEPVFGSRHSPLLARLTGVGEVAVGFGGLAFGGKAVAVLVTIAYASFTVVVYSAIARSLPTCGCFGSVSTAPTGSHAAVNALSMLIGIVAVIRSTPGVLEGVRGIGLWAAPTIVGTVVAAVLVVVVDTKPFGATFLRRNTYGGTDERINQRHG